MSCNLYFIRHGESLGNKYNRFLGHTDLDLSEFGYLQAKKTARYVSTLNIDTVYSSDLLRAYNTCNEFLKLTNIKATKLEALREIFAGDWENMKFDYLCDRFKDNYDIWLKDIGNSIPDNGESVKNLFQRVFPAINSIAKQNDGKNVAIFTHATVIRVFFNYAYGNKIEGMKNLPWATNCSVSLVKYDNGKFSVIEYSRDDFLGDSKIYLPPNV